jgi:glycosyltransferase involved in cell wall biosynthesis
MTPFAILSYCKLFYQLGRQKERQIILYSGFSEKIIPGYLPRFFNLPVYFIEYGPLAPIFKKLLHIPHLLYFLHQKNAKKVIVPSFNTKNALKNIFSEQKLTLIPCGAKAPIINKNTKIQKNLISVVSRLEKGKGQDLLIKAFLLAKKTIPDLKLQIIGQVILKLN